MYSTGFIFLPPKSEKFKLSRLFYTLIHDYSAVLYNFHPAVLYTYNFQLNSDRFLHWQHGLKSMAFRPSRWALEYVLLGTCNCHILWIDILELGTRVLGHTATPKIPKCTVRGRVNGSWISTPKVAYVQASPLSVSILPRLQAPV